MSTTAARMGGEADVPLTGHGIVVERKLIMIGQLNARSCVDTLIWESPAAAHLFLISAAMVMNACSTFVAFLAEVSRNGMPISSAKACVPTEVASA